MNSISNKTIGFAITASYCTFSKILESIRSLVEEGATVIPILSFNASKLDSRFMKAAKLKESLQEITHQNIIDTIAAAEPIGPKALLDLVIVAPCTGNTLAKLALGITDTPVTMACKAHLRNNRPVLIGVSTNDGLSASAGNIGKLLNTKGYYFISFSQDDCHKKTASVVADFSMTLSAANAALSGEQLQPVLK